MTPVELVVSKLAQAGCNPRKSGTPGEWHAKCPNQARHKHGDRNPSLSVGEGRDGNAVLTCHTGCPTDDVVRSLTLAYTDLFPTKDPEQTKTVAAIYDYHDEEGTLAFQAIRYQPKDFRQRQPDGRGGWQWNLRGIDRRPLYQLPQTLTAVAAGQTIWIAEGEKDVDALTAAGCHATCNPMGAGKWRPEHTDWLTGANAVEIVADDDPTGHAHARQISEALRPHVSTVRIWLPAEGCKDIADHLGQGRRLTDLRPFGQAAEPDQPPSRLRANLYIGSAILDIDPVEWLIHETIQSDGLTVVYGPPKSFKTFVTLDMVLHIANGLPWRDLKVRQARVLYIVAEGAPGVGPRARAWCQRFGGTLDNMAWITVAPDLFSRDKQDADTAEVADIAAELEAGLIVVDTLARAMPGGDENLAKDMGYTVSNFDYIREHAGCGLMAVHHTGKDQARGMRGSNALQGAVDTSIEVIGDKHAVNARIADQKNAEADRAWWWKPARENPSLVLEPTQGLDSSGEVRDVNILRQLQQIDTGGGVGFSMWLDAVTEREICAKTTFYERLKAMAEDGLVVNNGTKQRAKWALTVTGQRFVESATS